MTPERWLALAAGGLLTVATVGSGLALRSDRRRGKMLAVGARLAALAALLAALVLAAARSGGWSPFDLQQAALGWVLATVTIQLALTWRLGADGAGPVVDLVALALTLTVAFIIWPGAQPTTCTQDSSLLLVQWASLLVGAGAVVVAGSAGLTLALYAALAGRDWRLPRRSRPRAVLKQATELALVALGLGLTVGAWWSWWATGALAGGDPRVTWLAATWLLSAMSLLAWRLDHRPVRWAAGLAVAAAAAAGFGLLVVTDLTHLLGM